jgi:calcineurin-like phosphoesterase family protein
MKFDIKIWIFVLVSGVFLLPIYSMIQGGAAEGSDGQNVLMLRHFDGMPLTGEIFQKMQRLSDGMEAKKVDFASVKNKSLMTYDERKVKEIKELFDKYLEQFPSKDADFIQETVFPVGSKVTFFGDIHGSWNTLIKNLPTVLGENEYLVFLGDYVDRGQYGLETLIALIELKLKDPNKVFLLRGNHEQDKPRSGEFYSYQNEMNDFEVVKAYGFLGNSGFEGNFLAEIPNKVPSGWVETIAELFNRFVDSLPSALIIKAGAEANSYRILCLHGGVVRAFHDKRDERGSMDLSKPLYGLTPAAEDDSAFHLRNLCFQMRWTDFLKSPKEFSLFKNGRGHNTPTKAAELWMQENNIQLIVRGHQHEAPCVKLLSEDEAGFVRWTHEADYPVQQLEDKIITLSNAVSLDSYKGKTFEEYSNLQLNLGASFDDLTATVKQGLLEGGLEINPAFLASEQPRTIPVAVDQQTTESIDDQGVEVAEKEEQLSKSEISEGEGEESESRPEGEKPSLGDAKIEQALIVARDKEDAKASERLREKSIRREEAIREEASVLAEEEAIREEEEIREETRMLMEEEEARMLAEEEEIREEEKKAVKMLGKSGQKLERVLLEFQKPHLKNYKSLLLDPVSQSKEALIDDLARKTVAYKEKTIEELRKIHSKLNYWIDDKGAWADWITVPASEEMKLIEKELYSRKKAEDDRKPEEEN